MKSNRRQMMGGKRACDGLTRLQGEKLNTNIPWCRSWAGDNVWDYSYACDPLTDGNMIHGRKCNHQVSTI
jgi:hypothetical protein